jgi:hypothetical protein
MATQWTAQGITSGAVLPAATLQSIGAPSVFYTPTWTSTGTQPNIGNGSVQGAYFQFQKFIVGEIQIVVGSTTTFGTGTYLVSLPLPANSSWCSGFGMILDASAGYISYSGVALGTGNNLEFRFGNASGIWSPTVPITLANNDQVRIRFFYERT